MGLQGEDRALVVELLLDRSTLAHHSPVITIHITQQLTRETRERQEGGGWGERARECGGEHGSSGVRQEGG